MVESTTEGIGTPELRRLRSQGFKSHFGHLEDGRLLCPHCHTRFTREEAKVVDTVTTGAGGELVAAECPWCHAHGVIDAHRS